MGRARRYTDASSSYHDWTEEEKSELARLRTEGWSTGMLGKHFKLSKNAVAGKLHRLGIPSPEVLTVWNTERHPNYPATPPPYQKKPVEIASKPVVCEPMPAHVIRLHRSKVYLEPIPTAPVRYKWCCWPIGEPGRKDFRFCNVDLPLNWTRPYCLEHCDLAYVPQPKSTAST